MITRDPRIDPEAGDVVCSWKGASHAVVDEVGDVVRYHVRTPGKPDTSHVYTLADWQAFARLLTPLAERLAELQREHDKAHQRWAEIQVQMEFLRGET